MVALLWLAAAAAVAAAGVRAEVDPCPMPTNPLLLFNLFQASSKSPNECVVFPWLHVERDRGTEGV
jgi:hypothetical protein